MGDLISDAATCGGQLDLGERPLLGFPFRHGLQAVADKERAAGGIRHPS
jgi:hypothetical protein